VFLHSITYFFILDVNKHSISILSDTDDVKFSLSNISDLNPITDNPSHMSFLVRIGQYYILLLNLLQDLTYGLYMHTFMLQERSDNYSLLSSYLV
jgi:hypothetical protein